jgi:hypothetical protein
MKRFLLLMIFCFVANNVLAQAGPPTKFIFKYWIEIPPYNTSNNSSYTEMTVSLEFVDGTRRNINLTVPNHFGAQLWEGTEYLDKALNVVYIDMEYTAVSSLNSGVFCRKQLSGYRYMNFPYNYVFAGMPLNFITDTGGNDCPPEQFPDPAIYLRVIPAIVIVNKDRSDVAQTVYCDGDIVRLKADYHGGIPDGWTTGNDIAWQYRVGNGDFIPLRKYGRELTFTLKDLFGANYINYLDKRIEFRATGADEYAFGDYLYPIPMIKPDEGSNVLSYSFAPSTVLPKKVSAVEPLCSDGITTGLTIKFQRQLVANEKLVSITLNKLTGAVNPYAQYNIPITQLPADSIFSWTNIKPMPADSYWVNIEGKYHDTAQCNRTDYGFRVKAPAPVTFTAVGQDVKCFAEANGSITVTAAGGAGGYYYSKDNGTSWQNTSNVLSGLSKGTYTVLVKDKNGCISTSAETITLAEPTTALITGIISVKDPLGATTNDGKIGIAVSGGTTPYTYQWSNGAVTQDLSNGGGGMQTVTVTDSHGCTATAGVALVAPDPILITFAETPISCNGRADGALEATVTGGVLPYVYSWPGTKRTRLVAGIYTLQITDANGIISTQQYDLKQPALLELTATPVATQCDGSTDGSINTLVSGGTVPYIYSWTNTNNLSAGDYPLSVTDAHGCITAKTITVTSPAAITVGGTITTPTRYGSTDGAIITDITGGTIPYSYSWNNGSTSEDITGLGEADYTLRITDSHGCSGAHIFSVTQPDPLTMNVTMESAVLCKGLSTGVLMARINGGVRPYTYAWSNGAATETISGLPVGTYSVNVKDKSGVTASGTYTITEPTLLQLALTATEVSCGGESDGTVHSITNGGVMPYSYSWNTGAADADLNGVNGGMYTLHVTDANGCILSSSAFVTAPNALSISAVVNPPVCNGYADGNIDVTVTGGRLPYSYQWNTGETIEDLSALKAGDYTLRLTDNSGCLIIDSWSLQDPAALKADLGPDRTLCVGQSLPLDAGIPNGTIYNWSSTNGFTASTAAVTLNDAGTYTLLAQDNKGCKATDDIKIEKDAREIGADFLVSTQCYTGESVIAVNVSQPAAERVSWALPKAAKVISQSDNLVELSFNQAGNYELMLTTYRGDCEATVKRGVMVVNGVQLPDVNTQHTSLFKQTVLRPNPNNGQFYVDVEAAEDIAVNYRFLDVQRNLVVYEQKGQLSKDVLTSISFNIPGLPAGVYVLLIESVKDKKALKVMVL